VLSVETLAGDGHYLFWRFHKNVAFETIQNNLRLNINTREDGGNGEIIAIGEIYKVPASIYFVYKEMVPVQESETYDKVCFVQYKQALLKIFHLDAIF
jgi:hypothetical protein